MTQPNKRRRTRKGIAAFLTDLGFPISDKTLATKATRGGGPPYCLFSGRALYDEDEAVEWAEAQTTTPQRSTSEADAQNAA